MYQPSLNSNTMLHPEGVSPWYDNACDVLVSPDDRADIERIIAREYREGQYTPLVVYLVHNAITAFAISSVVMGLVLIAGQLIGLLTG